MMTLNVNTIRKPLQQQPQQQAQQQQQQQQQPDAKVLKEIAVIDPTSRYGKLMVPMAYTLDTKGRAEWIKCGGRLKKDLSICCLFQKGKCHVGERCFQVHIDRAYVTELRKKYAHLTTCCHQCGDVHSDNDAHRRLLQSNFPTGVVGVSFGGNGVGAAASDGSSGEVVELQATRLASTIGLEDALRFHRDGVVRRRDGTPVFAFGKVCRLHLKNACKYGRDCKNLHICHKCATDLGQEPADHAAAFEERRESRTRLPSIPSVPSVVETLPSCSEENSLCPTPEMRSRTSTPSLGSPMESCVTYSSVASLVLGAHSPAAEKAPRDAVDYVNGIAVSPKKQLSVAHAVAPQPQAAAQQQPAPSAADLGFLSRFQSHWQQPTAASTESLQIIFGGFPRVAL